MPVPSILGSPKPARDINILAIDDSLAVLLRRFFCGREWVWTFRVYLTMLVHVSIHEIQMEEFVKMSWALRFILDSSFRLTSSTSSWMRLCKPSIWDFFLSLVLRACTLLRSRLSIAKRFFQVSVTRCLILQMSSCDDLSYTYHRVNLSSSVIFCLLMLVCALCSTEKSSSDTYVSSKHDTL